MKVINMGTEVNTIGATGFSLFILFWWNLIGSHKVRYMTWRLLQGMVYKIAYDQAKKLSKKDYEEKYEKYVLEAEQERKENENNND